MFQDHHSHPFFQFPSAEQDLISRLAYLEGGWRPTLMPRFELLGILQSFRFIRIKGLANFWPEHPPHLAFDWLRSRMGQLLSATAAGASPIVFILRGNQRALEIYLGSSNPGLARAMLMAYFPGCAAQTVENGDVLCFDDLQFCAALTGIPAAPPGEQPPATLSAEGIDQLVRGLLSPQSWAWLVFARPFDNVASNALVIGWGQSVEQAHVEFQQPGTHLEASRLGKHYVQLLETQFERALIGRSQGNWQVLALMMSQEPSAADLALGVFSHPKAQPEPLRAIPCMSPSQAEETVDATSWLTSAELAHFIELPLREYPGYMVQQSARFDVALPEGGGKDGLLIGWVQDLATPTGQPYRASPDDLIGHTLIAGTTNSGKTNTSFHLIQELKKNGIPFLVIEPTKGEYRYLRSRFAEMRLYTMGSPEFPLRINPFYTPPGVPVSMHVDFLLSLFSASFVLYAPMPYVLEAALHEIYTDKGWDLAADLCQRDLHPGLRAFPTLTDLYNKIEEVTDRLGYEDRINADVKAALRARINSLRIGGKGAMLETREPFDMQFLLAGDSVIEMGRIGDDEQKAFLIGLLLMRLYEYYLGAGLQIGQARLRHVTIIEEAHRLLQNVPQNQGGDFANPRGKAVETFSNVITEIRAYGEGFVIVEQSPVKLTPDVLKNTNLKMVHRIISGDDRESLARVMNLDEKQQQALVSLRRGQAILFAGGMDRAIQVKVSDVKSEMEEATPLAQSVNPAEQFAMSNPLPQPEIARLVASVVVDNSLIQRAYARWVFNTAFSPHPGDQEEARAGLFAAVRSVTSIALRTTKMEQELLFTSLPRLADILASRLGEFYSWPFQDEECFVATSNDLWAGNGQSNTLTQLLDIGTQVAVRPYDACHLCLNACRYRVFTSLAIKSASTYSSGEETVRRYILSGQQEDLHAFYLYVRFIASRMSTLESTDGMGLALCAGIQLAALNFLDGPELIRLAEDLQHLLFKEPV